MIANIPNKQQRVEGALLGLLVGDALGVPYEFHASHEIPAFEQIEYEPPAGFNRSHKGTPPATWSDDGAQALCLLASLQHCGKLDMHDFAKRMRNWYRAGYMAVDHRIFDIGITTDRAIQNLENGVSPLLAGQTNERSNGNGSLMRVMPLVLWHKGTDIELIEDAQMQSRLTHGHVRSQLCCALYCLWARYLLCDLSVNASSSTVSTAWHRAVECLQDYVKNDSVRSEELIQAIQPLSNYAVKGSGYVVDSLHVAKYCLTQNVEGDFEKCIKKAIMLGNDTDTTACITGGIAGLVYGVQGIPDRWIAELRGKDIYQPLLNRLLSKLQNDFP